MFKRLATSMMLVSSLCLALAVPVLAIEWQGEGGIMTCPYFMYGKLTFKYKDIANVTPPGGPAYRYNDNDGLWHIRTRVGALGGGEWDAFGSPYLDQTGTFASCVYG